MGKSKLVVYLAGPMRGIPKYNFPAFDRAQAKLEAWGFEVINPAQVDRALGLDENSPAQTLKQYMVRDLPLVVEADVIALMDGWENSEGARIEHSVATGVGNIVMILTDLENDADERSFELVSGTAGDQA